MVFQCGAATTSGLYVFQLNSMGTATEAVLKVETLNLRIFYSMKISNPKGFGGSLSGILTARLLVIA